MAKLSKMATVADLGIERHDLRKFYENIDKMENLLKCTKCQKIVGTILTLQCNNLHRICSDCFSGSNCAFCNDGVSEGDIRKTNLDRFISALRQLKYLTNYNEAKTEEVEQNQRQKSAKSYVKFFVPNDVLKIHK